MKVLLEQVKTHWVKLTCVALTVLTVYVIAFPEKFNSDKEVISSTEGVIVAKDGAGDWSARFEEVKRFKMFEHSSTTYGHVIRDKENPLRCFLWVKYGGSNGGAAITPIECGY